MKLITQSSYFDAEAELVKYYCRVTQTPLDLKTTEYPYLMKQGRLPVLYYNGQLYCKGEIAKLICNWYMPPQHPNYEQLFNIFDITYQLLWVVDYLMWKPSYGINYKFRDLYSLADPINKIYQFYFTLQINRRYASFNEAQILQRCGLNFQVLQHYLKSSLPTILHQFIVLMLKMIVHNLRYSSLCDLLMKQQELKECIYKEFEVFLQPHQPQPRYDLVVVNQDTPLIKFARWLAFSLVTYTIFTGY